MTVTDPAEKLKKMQGLLTGFEAEFLAMRPAKGQKAADPLKLDNLAAALPLGWIFVRLGCFLERHHAGRRADFLLAVRYEDGPRHDLGLYDALAGLAIFLLLRALDRRPRPPGTHYGAAALAYGLLRFGIEHLRGEDLERIGRHSDPRYAGLTLVQYAAVVLVAIGAAFLRRARRA
jgi:phosphatidylglycerol:prolipoprotein diacylglycerol transferase